MKILVINAGSSSLKYQLFDMTDSSVMVAGIVERIGEDKTAWSHNGSDKAIDTIADHRAAMPMVVDAIVDPETGVIGDISQIDAIGHRVVQGGETFGSATVIDDNVKQAIRDNIPLAPLHNPANLTGIEVAEILFPATPNIAIFDTEFHQSMPEKAFLYALPYEYYNKYKIRKYGFHGTSHKYVSRQAAELLGGDIDKLNLITIHLGNGCSISAIEKGKSRDTSMGMTPLSGIMMGTRTGDFDPGIISYLLEQTGMDIKELEAVLNKKSGLKGICGLNDMRDINEASIKGNEQATLAVEMFCYQVKKYIGAYAAVLGNIDAIVFTAGVGENNAVVRAKICENLSSLGIDIDLERNKSKQLLPLSLHSADSRVQIWVIPTNEELQIALEVEQILK